jgi:hypothetical protein
MVLDLIAKILGLECEGRCVINFHGEDCEQQIQDHFPFAFSPPATQQRNALSKQLGYRQDQCQLPRVGCASLSLSP